MEALSRDWHSQSTVHQVSTAVVYVLCPNRALNGDPPVRIAQRTQPKKLAAHMRKMVDYFIFTLPHPSTALQINTVHPNTVPFKINHYDTTPPCPQVILRLNELVWKYNFFTLDRLILCMVRSSLMVRGKTGLSYCCPPLQTLRGYESQEVQTCLTIVHYLLLGSQEFSQRVNALVHGVSQYVLHTFLKVICSLI